MSGFGRTLALLTVLLFATGAFAAPHRLIFTPLKSSGTYAVGDTAGWRVEPVDGAACLHYRYSIKENNATLLKAGDLDLSSSSAKIEIQPAAPAMLLVEVEAACQATGNAPQEAEASPEPEALLGAAVAPELLGPVVAAPSDFDHFWRGKLKLLKHIPIDPELTPVPSGDASVVLYTVKLQSVGSHVQGYLATPVGPGKHPALILYQYAGVYKLNPQESIKRAAEGWLTLDVDSHDIAPDSDGGVPRDYYKIGLHNREASYFLDMYLRDTRALQYIRTRPDWDGKTIVLMGTSMGGQQSLVTAGLNPKLVTAVIVNEPAGADTNAELHGRKAGYPYWPSDDPQAMETSRYFDPINFAPHIKAATLLAVGFIDTTAPPAGLWTVYNQLGGPKEIVPMVESAHNNKTPDKQANYLRRSHELLDALRRGERLVLNSNQGAQPSGATTPQGVQ